jgi:hypothetical protein
MQRLGRFSCEDSGAAPFYQLSEVFDARRLLLHQRLKVLLAKPAVSTRSSESLDSSRVGPMPQRGLVDPEPGGGFAQR